MKEEKAALSKSISVSLKVSVILTARRLLSLLSCKLSSFLGLAVLPLNLLPLPGVIECPDEQEKG